MCMTMGKSTSACVCSRPTVRPKLVYMYCRFLVVVSLLMTFIIMSTCVLKDRNNKKPKRNVHFWITNCVLPNAANDATQPVWSRISHCICTRLTLPTYINKQTKNNNNILQTKNMRHFIF